MKRHLAPPGETSRVEASVALVLAPHFDDEILGCGGLVKQLCERGATVRVVFVSDGSGGDEGAPRDSDSSTYAVRRRAEAESVAELMGFEAVFADLPDGGLDTRLGEVEVLLVAHLEELEPDLVLLPSPLEVTPDHRAVFAGLFKGLHGLRAGVPLYETLRGARFLTYEVNHPGYPDVLVDVGDEIPAIEAAMALYASQQERHGYLEAALGLKRYRTLSLGRETAAAEGYRELSLDDFATHGLDELISTLGGSATLLEVVEGEAVSVVVRTRDRPELLAEALASLEGNSHRPLEVVVVNDCGVSPELPDGGDGLVFRKVDLAEHRGRAAAANAGVDACSNALIAFLDDDDLAGRDHISTLVRAARSAGVEVPYTDAAVVRLQQCDVGTGSSAHAWEEIDRRLPYSRDFDADVLLLDNYIPFNTLLFPRRLLERVGPFDESLPIFEDWDLLIRLSRETAFHHISRVTCLYRHFVGSGHHVLGARDEVDRAELFLETKRRLLEKHAHLLDTERLARVSITLRREMVETNERLRSEAAARWELKRNQRALQADATRHRIAAEQRQSEAAAIEAERAILQQRVFDLDRHLQEITTVRQRLEGELVAARQDREQILTQNTDLRVVLEEKMTTERELRAVVEDQTSHLERTYKEIGRLRATLENSLQGRVRRVFRALLGRPR